MDLGYRTFSVHCIRSSSSSSKLSIKLTRNQIWLMLI